MGNGLNIFLFVLIKSLKLRLTFFFFRDFRTWKLEFWDAIKVKGKGVFYFFYFLLKLIFTFSCFLYSLGTLGTGLDLEIGTPGCYKGKKGRGEYFFYFSFN